MPHGLPRKIRIAFILQQCWPAWASCWVRGWFRW
jgi:hypothetical protein